MQSIVAQDYCIPDGDCTFDEFIQEFSVNGFTNISDCDADNGADGYGDYTGLTGLEMGKGVAYEVTIVSASPYGYINASIWIDLDNSISFESSELLLADLELDQSNNGILEIPSSIPDGNYRLRLKIEWASPSSADPCAVINYYYGETEDYTVLITAPPSCLPVTDVLVSELATTAATIQWTENGTATSWDLELVKEGESSTGNPSPGFTNIQNPLILEGLESATAYTVYVRANCGMGDLASWSSPLNFTTECATFPTPYHENFSDFEGLPVPFCWSNGEGGNPSTGPTTLFNESGGWREGFNNDGTIGISMFELIVEEEQSWAISPIIRN